MRFNRVRSHIACSFISGSSGSPENRTQHYAVISRVWATSPRLPFQVGHPGVEPGTSCSQSRRATIGTSARMSPVRTAGFEPAISRSPDPQAGTPRDTRLRHVLPPAVRTPAQWAGRRSNPRLRLFRPALYRLSYRPEQEKPGVFCDTGLWQKSRYFVNACFAAISRRFWTERQLALAVALPPYTQLSTSLL